MIIVWEKVNNGFADDYFLEVNERIQSNPIENKEGTHYMVGSSRITPNNILELGKTHLFYADNGKPEWWNDRED